ncbi:guanine nucleotide-binding protein subunit alpha KNAG_0F03680 [Huiozyma naganishii CBS 8797]|uniref:Guanine nucleotide-binding protein alpha-2 subunit n=1 Tax=Huiozyma naganishii (strain ATCC MYA-139 / BCRC 22969 / CBS 8797 / KCTC 17520 / NBRC 10181 / NCYC 3082 / Yp74L-3) TaxID=1071383 RepID=J7R850_HUIN7|nr:hypothetical protein KNAG_0F03680 [Kazachstania naganishii CBS 8797]CCK71030.1 hypothetical protein KNAG_0F03680 [Kazachstania naganishii CBS 8797]
MGLCGSKEESAGNAGTGGGGVRRTGAPQKETKEKVKGTGQTGEKRVEDAGAVAAATAPASSQNPLDNTSDEEMKVLLLGAGESGKSTVLQQLKILHQNGFSDKELRDFVPLIHSNLVDVGRELIVARKKFDVEPDNGLTEQEMDDLFDFNFNLDQKLKPDGSIESLPNSKLGQFPEQFTATLAKLWGSSETQRLLQGPQSSQFYIMDSAPYFLEKTNLARITANGYKPTQQDVLRSRQKTSGIFDTHINMGSNLKLHFFDVGGQRSERKKWIHCFDNVALIIFCVSLSEYDQFLVEDSEQNRFQESLVLFDNIVNSRWFSRTSVVLFLNKIDLFAEKLKRKPLEDYFPDYNGGNNINKATKYILWRFVQLNRANLNIYPHVTQATDTSNIKLVFAAIKESILENSLKDTGVL